MFFFSDLLKKKLKNVWEKHKVISQENEKNAFLNEELKECNSLSNGGTVKNSGERTNNFFQKKKKKKSK